MLEVRGVQPALVEITEVPEESGLVAVRVVGAEQQVAGAEGTARAAERVRLGGDRIPRPRR
jgi:hypothetical protein